MKLLLIGLAWMLLVNVSSASAAPRWVYDACWRAAQRVTPILTEPEKEQYVANCLADWTAGTPPPRGNTDRNRY
jgi:hypothetical protein